MRDYTLCVFVLWITPFATPEGAVSADTAILTPPVCGLLMLNRLAPLELRPFYPFIPCHIKLCTYILTRHALSALPFLLPLGYRGGLYEGDDVGADTASEDVQ